MTRAAIRTRGLGKRYQIGRLQERAATLREALSVAAASPFRRLAAVVRGEAARVTGSSIWALRDVDLEVPEGQVLGVLGRNGAGKSTLLKVLSRITSPTTGVAEIRGRVGSLLEVGTGFHPELSGRDNIFLNGAILGMRRAEIHRQLEEIVAFAEVEKFLDTAVKHYSSGMYLRLAFAVAAHLETEVLLVDEVLAVGDASFQRRCLGKMAEVSGRGRTVLFVSHNMAALQQFCHRCVWIDEGCTAQDGDAGEVIAAYLRSSRDGVRSAYSAAERKAGSPDAEAFLLEASVLGASGEPATEVRCGEPFSIRMAWAHSKSVPGVDYYLRLFDSTERQILAANTYDSQMPESLSGTVEACCEVRQNVLAPGDYTVTIGAFRRPRQTLHQVEHCVTLTVLDVPYHEGRVVRGRGSVIVPETKWLLGEKVAEPRARDA